MKNKIQRFGKFLSAMVMPNIGAFIAWGFITALFIEAGWLPNAKLAIIEGSHFIASENPKVFNRVVEQWLSRVQHER